MEYITRVIDKNIDEKVRAFNAINIVGPKGFTLLRIARIKEREYFERGILYAVRDTF